MRVLSFSQLSISGGLHGYYEITLLNALALRGAEIYYYACPGLEICDLFRAPDKTQNCSSCISESFDFASRMRMKLRSMEPFIKPQDDNVILDWIGSLDPRHYPVAKFGSFEIGKWTFSSFNTTIQAPSYSYIDPLHRKIYGLYLAAGLRLCLYTSRIIENFTSEDRVLLYNGRMSISNIPREIAIKKGITVYLHERGGAYGKRALYKNGPLIDFDRRNKQWSFWSKIPLTKTELEQTKQYLLGRQNGDYTALNNPPLATKPTGYRNTDIYSEFLNKNKIWALFTSSTDELEHIASLYHSFDSQHQWLMTVMHLMPNYPDAHLIIRVHPHIQKKKSAWERDFYRILQNKTKDKITIIDQSSSFSSYDLMDMADAGLAYVSTCGMEMAAKGKPVLLGGMSLYEGIEGIIQGDTPEKLKHGMDVLYSLPTGYKNTILQCNAFRYFNFLQNCRGMDFPLMKPTSYCTAVPAYSSIDDLAPGKDATLDFFCDTIMEERDPFIYPGESDVKKTTDEEDAFFAL